MAEHMKAMADRHHKERQGMHTKHEGEQKAMSARHMQEMGMQEGGEPAGDQAGGPQDAMTPPQAGGPGGM